MMRATPALLATVAMLAGCASNGTPTPIGHAAIDIRTMERLLTASDIESVGGDAGGLDERTEDVAEIVGMVNPDQLEGVEAWFSRSFTSAAKPSIVMALRRFDDTALTLEQMQAIESGGAFESMDAPVGDRSAVSVGEPDGGGHAIAFVTDRTLVMLQCPAASDGTTLLTAEQLRALAQIIEARL